VPDHLGSAALDALTFGEVIVDDQGDDVAALDSGGLDLLEGPITDNNLDGVDDTAQLHGHG
jgi:hypothetical protein